MDNRKEPPFFNDDNMGPYYYRLHFYDTMELFIETLTGTCFELRVSPFETIISVKAKIRRLEGIPICRQHLIWNNMELENDYCLYDYNLSHPVYLKAILAMRGGPINARRVPTEDPLRKMAEYLDSSPVEVWEKTSCNKQVTFLLYREGDQLNFFPAVDRGDGTSTPLSDSSKKIGFHLHVFWRKGEHRMSDGSMYNSDTDEDEETEPSSSGQQIIENSITMNKMKLLKAKMKNMNLSKKPKKAVKIKPHPPIAPRPSSGSTAPSCHRLLKVLPNIGQSCLPAFGNAYLPEISRNGVSSLATQLPAERSMSSITGEFLKENNSWETNTLSHSSSNVKLPPQIPHLELGNDQELADSVLHLGSSRPRQTKHFLGNLPSSNEDTVLPSEECVIEESLLPEVGSLASFADGNADEQSSSLEDACKVNPELLLTNADKGLKAPEQHLKHAAGVLSGESVETSVLNYRELSPHKNRLLSRLRCSAPLHNSLVKPQRQSKCFEFGKLQPSSRSLDVQNITDCSSSRTPRFQGVKVDSPGKRSDVISKVEARDITEMANKASKEPVDCVNNISFLASLARSTSRDRLQSTRGAGRPQTSGIGLSTNLQHFQEENLRKSSPQLEHPEVFLSAYGVGMNGNNAATGKSVGECTTHHLPPVKAPLQAKKKKTNHCFLCGKKTGLASSYECRCGNNFCASHRYAETHGCTYDYKSAGRRYLHEANPVVNAPKLPKI
ncbi:PREDICTED: AN1-type zinc finger protein 4 isoform X8 [Cercocebus atys]|uniref:AN1-type zinc finger protein 4 isoform X8 n=1 Tax=Cercocebus atys TaxID=9531 RepID=UPI0005F52A5F|nr:PREDICTED: AN1-type zinc finger protein 4 isoform X8 [Cercocebus atys]